MRISDWSSDVCSSDLRCLLHSCRWPQPQLRDACDRHRRALGALLAFRPALPALTTPDLLNNIYIVAGYVPTGGVINSGIKCRVVSNSLGGSKGSRVLLCRLLIHLLCASL